MTSVQDAMKKSQGCKLGPLKKVFFFPCKPSETKVFTTALGIFGVNSLILDVQSVHLPEHYMLRGRLLFREATEFESLLPRSLRAVIADIRDPFSVSAQAGPLLHRHPSPAPF